MKQRDDTTPQAIIIDTANLSLEFADFLLYAMSEKQAQALEYAREIIAENKNGINMKNLVNEIKRRAKIDEVEICRTNALYKLLKEFENKSFKFVRNNNHNAFIIYPL